MTNSKNHYDNLKVLKNAKPFVIDAAYKALLQDLSSSKDSENQKLKEIIVSSYSVLSDPAQRAAYDKAISQQPIDRKESSKNTSAPEDKIKQKLDNTKNSEPTPKVVVNNILTQGTENKPILKKNALITFLSILSITGIGIIGYLGYLKMSEDGKNDSSKEIAEKIKEQQVAEPVKNYDSLKQAEVERANSKQQRRDAILAQQEKIEFDDFSQQSESMKKIMQADVENIAIIQKSIQDADLKMQGNIRENATLEQEEADKYVKDEGVRQVEIKSILVEQNQIERDLIEKEKNVNDLEQQLPSLIKQEEVLVKQAEIKSGYDKAILDITTKLNNTWSSMSNDIENSLKGLDKKVTSQYRCIVNVRLNYDGKVLDVILKKESGNFDFDYLVKTAVQQASPFIVPQDADMFEKEFKSINLTFTKNSVIFK